MVSQNPSPKLKPGNNTPSAVLPVDSPIDSIDLEAATVNEEKHSSRHHETPLERRTSAVNEAWPTPELEANPELMKEAIKEEKDVFLVTFDDNDPLDPKNWSKLYRWYLTFASSLLVLNASFASSAPSGMLPPIMSHFEMSQIEGTLTISLFLLGYCVGPFLWAPTSEQIGRRPMFIVGFLGYFILQIACAVAPNTAALLVFRFLGGCFAACPLTNSGAVLGDIWDNEQRGSATAIFTLSPFAGPSAGPLVAGALMTSNVSWQWLFWILSIFAGICWIMIIVSIPETYGPVILVQKAKALRASTGDPRYKAALELNEVSFAKKLGRILGRPWKIFFVEPMLVIITLYMSFVYGLLYLLFLAYPVVFVQGHGFNGLESGLTFLPIFIGGIMAVFLYLCVFAPIYLKVSQAHDGKAPPESRLPMAQWGGPILAISMFWFGWTSYPWINYWVPVVSGLGLGLSVVLLFLSLFNYIIDAYLPVAASALASSTVVRSAFGAGFPLFGKQMYETLDPRIASTVLAACTLLLVPVPFVFEKYGPAIRKRSKYGLST